MAPDRSPAARLRHPVASSTLAPWGADRATQPGSASRVACKPHEGHTVPHALPLTLCVGAAHRRGQRAQGQTVVRLGMLS